MLSSRRRRRFADGSEAPAELSEHLDEVRPEPLVDDLSIVVEPEREHERGVDVSLGGLFYEQPSTLLRSSDVLEHDDDVAFGDDPFHLCAKVGESLQEPTARRQHRRIGCELFEGFEIMTVRHSLDQIQYPCLVLFRGHPHRLPVMGAGAPARPRTERPHIGSPNRPPITPTYRVLDRRVDPRFRTFAGPRSVRRELDDGEASLGRYR